VLRGHRPLPLVLVLLAVAGIAGAIGTSRDEPSQRSASAAPTPRAAATPAAAPAQAPRRKRPGGVYAAATATTVAPRLADVRERVYVPDSEGGMLEVIDARRMRVVGRYPVGAVPHHVTPSWDMRRLYVLNTASNSLTVIDPRRGKPVKTIPVTDPYNLYFTPDGRHAIVVAEREQRLDFRDPRTWRLQGSVPIPWPGVDHLDFSADGRYLLASCEFSGMVAKVDVRRRRVAGRVHVGGMPVDVKLDPGGRYYYVANQGRSGVSVIDGRRMREVRFIPTGRGAHGLLLSRDARSLYVSNRLAGTISVLDLRRRRVRATWRIGGSPDMGMLSPDGRRMWISGRFHDQVYVIDTRTGRLIRSIPVGAAPHGLTYFPAPGRYSVGHNGVYR
jgi:YVTN family beta-propeller protein